MIYSHIVKHNGKYYAAGEEVPENEEPLSLNEHQELTDEDIVFEENVVGITKTPGRRGRPKKA